MEIEKPQQQMSVINRAKAQLGILKGWLVKSLKGWPGRIMLLVSIVVIVVFLTWCYIRPSTAVERKDAVQLITQVLGVLGLAVTFYFSWRNLTLTQNTASETLKNAQENLRLSQEEQITGRFTKAIEQLGSDSLAIRLGGIYALERIARDSERDHWPIMEILTAYVREHSPWKTEELKNIQPASDSAKRAFTDGLPPLPELPGLQDQKYSPPSNIPALPIDIQAILTVLGRRNLGFEEGKDQRLDLRDTDLRQAQLSMAKMRGVILWHTHLERAQLICADFEEASFMEAHLEEAICSNANLRGADFSFTRLNGTDLSIAHLEGADLSRAIGLNWDQVNEAIGYAEAKLPSYLNI